MKSLIVKLAVCSYTALLIFSCVPVKKFEDEQKKRKDCEAQNADLKNRFQQASADNKELAAKRDELEKRNKGLVKDTAVLGESLRKMQTVYDKINNLNNELQSKLEKQKSLSMEDQRKMLSELQLTKEDLIKKQADLNNMERVLNEREANLNALNEKLKASQAEFDIQQKKLEELQSVLNKKDSVVKALRTKVSDALLGFENKGLTISQKNGKVYVSMEEALLFASGSFTINKRGADALRKLSVVLETNTDINVLVEGHTDNVPYKGANQLKDNWDLSVMRATTVVKTILQGSRIDPARLTAAGRSEYFPIDANTSSEGKARNRRTEIILTPKLDELFKIIETN